MTPNWAKQNFLSLTTEKYNKEGTGRKIEDYKEMKELHLFKKIQFRSLFFEIYFLHHFLELTEMPRAFPVFPPFNTGDLKIQGR